LLVVGSSHSWLLFPIVVGCWLLVVGWLLIVGWLLELAMHSMGSPYKSSFRWI
jgi:hypothetical protein